MQYFCGDSCLKRGCFRSSHSVLIYSFIRDRNVANLSVFLRKFFLPRRRKKREDRKPFLLTWQLPLLLHSSFFFLCKLSSMRDISLSSSLQIRSSLETESYDSWCRWLVVDAQFTQHLTRRVFCLLWLLFFATEIFAQKMCCLPFLLLPSPLFSSTTLVRLHSLRSRI